MAKQVLGTAAARRLKRQRQRERLKSPLERGQDVASTLLDTKKEEHVEYVPEELNLPKGFESVMQRFAVVEGASEDDSHDEHNQAFDVDRVREALEATHDIEDEQEQKMSKRKLKKLCRMSLAELKKKGRRPDLVEWEDVTSKDPELLVYLKGYRNTVPVPKHWSRKRKYLAGKRGFIKPPFELPAFIRNTGITEAREAARKQDASKTLKVKAREKMRPKLGKLSVDYQKLYDAFFKYQTKPPLTIQGDLYFEGKEFETKYKDKRAGFLSDDARAALGMGPLSCPPWLYNMQRYGPPPSYQHLKIPGLNAPIPEGAQWGYHSGGWGKPPVDDATKSVFEGISYDSRDPKIKNALLRPVEYNLWGEFEPEEEEELEQEQVEEVWQ